MFQIGNELPLFHSRRVRTVVGEGARHAGKQEFPKGRRSAFREVACRIPPPHHRDDTTRERGRPARILFLELPLSFPAMRQPTTLPAGTEWARPKQSLGAVASRPGWRRRRRLRKDLCGRDARAPGWSSSHDVVTPREQDCRSIRAPLVIEGGPSVFVLIRVHWWFVFISGRLFHLFRIRTPGRRKLANLHGVLGVLQKPERFSGSPGILREERRRPALSL